MKSHFLNARPMVVVAVAAVLSLLLLQGCVVYKIDIQQGNEITAEMLEQLELGMSRREVSKALGFPLINDPFHADRWDYYFYLKTGRTGKIEQQSATLHFNDDTLIQIESSLIEMEEDG